MMHLWPLQWEVGECCGTYYRPNFDTMFYPYQVRALHPVHASCPHLVCPPLGCLLRCTALLPRVSPSGARGRPSDPPPPPPPLQPPHITRPKEVKKVFLVPLPERCYFGVPKNFRWGRPAADDAAPRPSVPPSPAPPPPPRQPGLEFPPAPRRLILPDESGLGVAAAAPPSLTPSDPPCPCPPLQLAPPLRPRPAMLLAPQPQCLQAGGRRR